MHTFEHGIKESVTHSDSRFDMWIQLTTRGRIKRMAEIGVYRGEFAARLLEAVPSIERYYMIDPWRHLDDWNKPANKSNEEFERYLRDAMDRTEFAANKRQVLRGRTLDVIEAIPDGELDFAYIDGDHTLKGIAIDLMRVYPKIRVGGWIGGDDFHVSIWQHSPKFEPSLVFPFSVYFAEAVGAEIYALPHHQFLIEKKPERRFSFIDLTGEYQQAGLRDQFNPWRIFMINAGRVFRLPTRILRWIMRLVAERGVGPRRV